MMALLLSTACAAEIGVGVGFGMSVDDPFTAERGLTASAVVAPLPGAPWAAVGLGAGLYPDLGDGDLGPLGQNIVETWKVSPSLSPVRHQVQATLQLTSARQAIGRWDTRVGVHGGIALMHTVDDLDLFQVDPEDVPEGTISQWHPAPLYGLHADLRTRGVGLRTRLERARWQEQIDDLELEHGPWWLGLDLILWR